MMANEDRIQKAKDLKVGSRIFYTGDVANNSWWGVVVSVDRFEDMVSVEHPLSTEDARPVSAVLIPRQIGTVYKGDCDPRFVTGEAYNAYIASGGLS